MFDGFIKIKSTKDHKYSDINLPWVEKYRPKNSEDILLDLNKLSNLYLS